jgi:hypothetical protein
MIKMFNEIVLNLKAQEEDYLRLKSKDTGTTLERSIDNILNRIYDDIKKLLKLKVEFRN